MKYTFMEQDIKRDAIIEYCLKSKASDPYLLVLELMNLPTTAMHGPEHHLLLPAALLTALCNAKGRTDLADLLEEANKRSSQVPGGACGAWGICGAAIGAGIFSCMVLESSPLAEEAWRSAGQLTAKCADSVSKQGGPRCCKRDSYTVLLEAIAYCNQVLAVEFVMPEIICQFATKNKQCKKMQCHFYPHKEKVAFICVHNSCRSQIAEALCKHLASDKFECYSAGTELKNRINPDAVRLMKKLYGIDMERTQKPKLLADIPSVDTVITMGCNVSCPILPAQKHEDWGLDDPTGKSDSEFINLIQQIEAKVNQMRLA